VARFLAAARRACGSRLADAMSGHELNREYAMILLAAPQSGRRMLGELTRRLWMQKIITIEVLVDAANEQYHRHRDLLAATGLMILGVELVARSSAAARAFKHLLEKNAPAKRTAE